MSARVVTISATFGAGGGSVGPAVAERLGLPFVDRAIPVTVAAEIGCSLEEALAHDDRAESGIGRILAGAARLPNVTLGGMDVYLPDRTILPEEEFVVRTEHVMTRAAEGEGGVLLGRAGAVVLKDRVDTLHVRLDAPKERRLARARVELLGTSGTAGISGEPPKEVGSVRSGTSQRDLERMLDDNDRARAAYVKHFYGADPADSRLYHLVIDSTRLPEPAVVDLIVAAARVV
ncbi:cytidylate kinase-like family protein [Actinomadura rudentiformis]|uniref:Cytidylate kinase-like family protein n=1 Tax=Actinomadura rudentiformis TaxID=359158 RepID=A0A6H9YUP6_9ACTN|nr:cytidylate kinase-like family protein [Actinomadura rudentiformis]KAB2345990.1 cytidylate kinase-like family protein [Actinomadura rudentiformis]